MKQCLVECRKRKPRTKNLPVIAPSAPDLLEQGIKA